VNIWKNGQIVSASGALDATDRGVLLGDGIFETLALLGGRPQFLDRHLARLSDGAKLLGIPLQTDRAGIEDAIRTLAADAAVEEGAARITLLRGSGPRGVAPPAEAAPTLLVAVTAMAVGETRPVTAVVAKSTRRNERSPVSRLKTTNYLDAILASREAAGAGADDAIMLNTRDAVAEATSANVFCVIGGDLVTPPVSDGALPGVMRERIMVLETVIERSLTTDDLGRATEIILTSSLSVRPVTMLDGQPVGDGASGPVATRLAGLPRRTD